MSTHPRGSSSPFGEPDWDFFLPDDDAYPEPGDFWIEPDDDEF